MKKLIMLIIGMGLTILSACGSTQPSPEEGQNLAVLKGCTACHSVDDSTKIAPPWRGLYGSQVELADGSKVTVDEAYLTESITAPNAKLAKGFTRGSMPAIALTEYEIASLVAYIKSVE